jgi:hypothetical protein
LIDRCLSEERRREKRREKKERIGMWGGLK